MNDALQGQRGRYRIYHVLMDMDEGDEEEFRIFRRAIDKLEEEHRGVLLYGNAETFGWPAIVVNEVRGEP